MSGEKDTIINLCRSEYNRIMSSCRRADKLEAGINRHLREATGRMRQQMNSQVAEINQRHNRFENALSNMSSTVQQIERETNFRLKNMADYFQNGLNFLGNVLENQRDEYLSLIQEQGEYFSQALNEQRQQINAIQEHITAKEEHAEQQAKNWLNDTQILLNTIDESYKHEKFKPGELSRLQGELRMAEGDIQNGQYEAAIATTQRTYLHTQDLRMELESLTLEWNSYLTVARQSAAEALAACDTQMSAQFILETDEGAEEVAAEIDFWTYGALSELRDQVAQEQEQLDKPEEISLDELKQSIAKSEQWRLANEELTQRARHALVASILRNNIAQTIESVLGTAGWKVLDAVWEGEDERRAMHVKLGNPAGDEIVTIIIPETGADNAIRNLLRIFIFDNNTNDKKYRDNFFGKLTENLKKEGLDCGDLRCAAGTENQPATDKSKLDFDEVRRRRNEVEKQSA
ncbi:MAG: hypothetical protein GY795_28975 [Desulfobacterales bacterium]|nr:hypothetical protein [Desulfobacterales bacterium]